jgi:hypothetical protein
MPRTHRQRPITYRDHQRRVWYLSEVAKLRVVSASTDGPNVALVIRFEREGEARFARWIGGEDWRAREALDRLFTESELDASGTAVAAPKPEVTDPTRVASPAPNDTGTRGAGQRTLAPWEYEPQKAVLVAEPPAGDRWLHELKLDGFRMGVLVAGRGKTREVMIISRNGTDYTAAFPEIVEAAMELRQAALREKAGRITSAGIKKEVTFSDCRVTQVNVGRPAGGSLLLSQRCSASEGDTA